MFRALALGVLVSLLPGAQEIGEQLGHLLSTGVPAHGDADSHHADPERSAFVAFDHGGGEHQEPSESHCSAVAHTCRCCPATAWTLVLAPGVIASAHTTESMGMIVAPLDDGIQGVLIRPPIG